ncbi:cobalt-precorrin-6A reductase [Starkeya sp. ORNL1]|uniref:cobalt-precorrin-6A reductase n=1 Tax=Starkeya sp. ORNL1 TaxID=2709380 RepID=UPI001FF00BC7|nr:cobalt-precorrin-6A reductase [Starkeya sp. ORNL1]
MSTRRILILGGTTEARLLAERLAARDDINVTVSLAGRTRKPLDMPATIRVGGFGGAGGLAEYLRAEAIDALVDATHPFAATMSFNAAEAARLAGVPLLALARAPWEHQPGDIWREAADVAEAVSLLGATSRRVLVALGRNEVSALEAAPQHAYWVRSVDPVEPPLRLDEAHYIVARGPFPEGEERDLLKRHRIDAVLAKNSGGDATYGKIAAARTLGIEVILVKRPPRPEVPTAGSVEAAMVWLNAHPAALALRGE